MPHIGAPTDRQRWAAMQTGSQAARQAARQIRTEREKRVAITAVMSVVKARETEREGSKRRTERERVKDRETESCRAWARDASCASRFFPSHRLPAERNKCPRC